MKKTILIMPLIVTSILVACNPIGSPSYPASVTATLPDTPMVSEQLETTPTLPVSTTPDLKKPISTTLSTLAADVTLTTTSVPIDMGSTPSPTFLGDNSGLGGRIFIWNLFLGYLDPRSGLTDQFPIDINLSIPNKSEARAAIASGIYALGFSYYSWQVAIATIDAQKHLQLWVGDLDLADVDLVWTDEKNWLNFDSGYDTLDVKWLFNDQFLVLKNRSNIILYNLKQDEIFRLSGFCGWIAVSPKTAHLAVWCPGASETPNYQVLENDGTSWSAQTIPSANIETIDWVFAPHEEKVLYASPENKLGILGNTLNSEPLPVKYKAPYWDIPQRVLQWSQDGLRLLVFASEDTGGLCTNELRTCWLVLDSQTLEVIWQPDEYLARSGSDATLSPDGRWIVLFVMKLPDRYGFVVSLDTGVRVRIYDWIAGAVVWAR